MIVEIDTTASLYEFYKKGIIQALYKKGNPPAVYFRYYEVYLTHRKSNNIMTSYSLAADECGVNERTIMNAVRAIER